MVDSERVRVEQFQESTKEKLRGLRCPDHRQPPRVRFSGASLRDITVSLSGCCAKLMELANARIATAAAGKTSLHKSAWQPAMRAACSRSESTGPQPK